MSQHVDMDLGGYSTTQHSVQGAIGSALIQQTGSDMKLPLTAYSCRKGRSRSRDMRSWPMQLCVGMLQGRERSQIALEVLQMVLVPAQEM